MKELAILIPGQENLNYFSIFYQFAFLIPFLLLLIIGIKRKYPMGSWLAIIMSASFFFLLGTRLSTFNINEWALLFSQGIWPASYHKFALGGASIALIGISLTRRFLGFDKPVLQLYAWITPIGLAIQKLGCLFSGCCFGSPTMLPWGIQYSSGTIPYHDHLVSGLIEQGETCSLPIHPTQVYQIILYLTISVLVLSLKKRFKSQNSTIVFALFLLFLFRFLLEFAIDPQASVYGGNLILGLKIIQWLCLIGFLSSLIFLFIFEKKEYIVNTITGDQFGVVKPVSVFILITLFFGVFHNAFTSNELIAFNVRFLIITCIFIWIIFKRITIRKLRVFSLGLIILPLFLLSQTVPKQTLDFEERTRVGIGTSFGHYFNEVRYNPQQGSCGTYYDRELYENTYFTLGGEYSITGRSGFQSYSYGTSLTAGYIYEKNLVTSLSKNVPMLIANPYAEYNWHWFGIGANAHIGYVPFTQLNPSTDRLPPKKNHMITPVLPGFMARIGPYNWFDLRVKFASGFPSPLPTHLWDISYGTGLGKRDGSGLRMGTTFPLEESIYFEGQYLFNKKLGVGFVYTFKENYFTSEGNNNEFKVGVSYLLDKK